MKRQLSVVAIAAAVVLGTASPASAAVSVTTVVVDPFTNATSQHQTAVEPDTFAFGSTIVTATQIGRYFNGGASGIGFATSTDSGATWTSGQIPGLTKHQSPPGPWDRSTDPSVAYDAKHNVWLVQSLPLTGDSPTVGPTVVGVVVNRSTDGGLTWGGPIDSDSLTNTAGLDKNWIACDNYPASPFYGNCYQEFDDNADGNRLYNNVSADGGLTWGPARRTANNATGLGGQPVVQPNGTVIVPSANANETAIIAYKSTDGGASWSTTVTIATVADHTVAGSLRSGPLPSAEIDSAGKVYVVWQDCRFRRGCKSNDIVLSTSVNGTTWTAPSRVPIDAVSSNVDHFIPGLGVDPATSGSTAKLGLTYYFYRNGKCTASGTSVCQLEVGHIQSANGGGTWANHTDVAGPFPVTQIANTSQGRMVGDYISTSWIGGKAVPAFAVAPGSGPTFQENLAVPAAGFTASAGGFINTGSGDRAVPGAAADHAAPRSAIRHN